MQNGIPKQKEKNENRVAITPAVVLTLVNTGHKLFVEKDADRFQNAYVNKITFLAISLRP